MFTKIKLAFIKSVKNKKLNVFGLFLLFSFLILVLSKLSKSYTETISIPIEVTQISDEIVFTDSTDASVNVVVTTHGFNLLASYFKRPKLTIDFRKDVTEINGVLIYEIQRNKPSLIKELGSGILVENVQPDTLFFPFSVLETRRVPVKLNSNATYALGFDSLHGFSITPDSIDIVGSEEDVKRIEYVETSELNIKNIKDSIHTEIKLIPITNAKTVKLTKSSVLAKAKVEKFTEGILEIPVSIVNLPSELQINYFPKTIKVSYDVSLNNYKDIKPTDFKIECDFKTNLKSYLIPELKQKPSSVKRVKLKQKKIEYIIVQ